MASNTPGYRFTLRTFAARAFGWLSFFAATLAASAQPIGTGTVQGRVFNPATGEYVRNAEIRVAGTERVTYSEEGGSYVLNNVPAGTATVSVSFSGYQTASAPVVVTSGATATRDFELVSTLARGSGEEALKMGAFIVSTEREGNAKAIMEQRRNMNISTSVAADSFGETNEGNVGEFLKFLPGVDIEYVDGVSRGPRLGGLDQQYVGVTMDGAGVASADAFIAYGNTLNGTAGGQSRSVGFEQMSITSVESIEVSRTISADMDANSPAGNINMKSRRAFDRKGRRIDWQFSIGANAPDAFTLEKVYGPDDHKRYQARPNFQFDYSDVFLKQRLGIRASLSHSSVRAEQQYVTHTYNRTPTAADRRPMVLTALTFADGPKLTDRDNVTMTADFKATPNLVLSFTGMFNRFENSGHTKNLVFTAAANGTAAATGRQNVIGDLSDIRTNGLATNTSRTVAHAGGSAIKLTNSLTLTPRFEYRLGNLTLDGVFNYSRSNNDYETSTRGTIRVETMNALVADFRATRSDPMSAEWTITQNSGADWSNLGNYTNPRISEEERGGVTEIYTGELNARYAMRWRFPITFKMGGKVAEELRMTYNQVPYLTYSYIGPGGNILNPNGTITTAGSFAAYPSPRAFNAHMGHINALNVAKIPQLANRSALSLLYREHPEYFVNIATAENYYTAFVANARDFDQLVSAGYGMADARLGKLQIRAGLRWERTESTSKEFDPLTAAEVQRAGFPVSTTTRRATTIPGMQYQYFSNPRVDRDGDYENFFPSASAKYSIRPNLQAQLGYSHAISRPPIDALSGVWNINDVALVVTAPNPELKPETSHNYVARLAYYFEPSGSFTVLVQQTEITDQRISERISADGFGYGDDPEFAAYEFQSWRNRADIYRYRNFEVGYNQHLSFLPGFLRSTNVNVSYTRSYANRYFPGVTPHRITGNLSFNLGRLSLRTGAIWADDTPFTTTFGRYQRHNIKVDLSGAVKITPRTSFFFSGRNIFNDPQLLMEGDPIQGAPAALYRYGNYGVSWIAGVRGNF
jgi:iron complex outermembrane receptor protein